MHKNKILITCKCPLCFLHISRMSFLVCVINIFQKMTCNDLVILGVYICIRITLFFPLNQDIFFDYYGYNTMTLQNKHVGKYDKPWYHACTTCNHFQIFQMIHGCRKTNIEWLNRRLMSIRGKFIGAADANCQSHKYLTFNEITYQKLKKIPNKTGQKCATVNNVQTAGSSWICSQPVWKPLIKKFIEQLQTLNPIRIEPQKII